MTEKITSKEIHMARMVLNAMDDDQTEIPEAIKEDIRRYRVFDVAVIQHLINRIKAEGTLPEESHRYLAKGAYKEWGSEAEETMPNEIFNEFPTKDGLVQITGEEFMDILAYVANSYYG